MSKKSSKSATIVLFVEDGLLPQVKKFKNSSIMTAQDQPVIVVWVQAWQLHEWKAEQLTHSGVDTGVAAPINAKCSNSPNVIVSSTGYSGVGPDQAIPMSERSRKLAME